MEKEFYKGSSDYDRSTKDFIPDEGMKTIRSMLKTMEYSVSANKNEGNFYYRPSDDTWWHLREYETSDSTLERVTREHIEKHYPYVECDNRVPVDWLD
jgi:hypothetical protein